MPPHSTIEPADAQLTDWPLVTEAERLNRPDLRNSIPADTQRLRAPITASKWELSEVG